MRFPKIFDLTCSDLSNHEKYLFFVIFKLYFRIICSCSNYLKYMGNFDYRSILVDSGSIVYCSLFGFIFYPIWCKITISSPFRWILRWTQLRIFLKGEMGVLLISAKKFRNKAFNSSSNVKDFPFKCLFLDPGDNSFKCQAVLGLFLNWSLPPPTAPLLGLGMTKRPDMVAAPILSSDQIIEQVSKLGADPRHHLWKSWNQIWC